MLADASDISNPVRPDFGAFLLGHFRGKIKIINFISQKGRRNTYVINTYQCFNQLNLHLDLQEKWWCIGQQSILMQHVKKTLKVFVG